MTDLPAPADTTGTHQRWSVPLVNYHGEHTSDTLDTVLHHAAPDENDHQVMIRIDVDQGSFTRWLTLAQVEQQRDVLDAVLVAAHDLAFPPSKPVAA